MMSHCAFVCGLLLAVLAITQGFPHRPAEKPTLVGHLRGLQQFIKLAGHKKPIAEQKKWIPPLSVSGLLARKNVARAGGCTDMYNAIKNTINAMSGIMSQEELQENGLTGAIGEGLDIFNDEDLKKISCDLVTLGQDKSVLSAEERLQFDAGMQSFTEVVNEMKPLLAMEEMKGSPYYDAVESMVGLHQAFDKAGLLA